MVIENANISKNVDGTFMIRVFIDDEDEKVEIVLDKVILEDFIVKQEKVVENLSTKEDIREFHVDLKGIALFETNDESGNVGRVIKYPKKDRNND